MVVDINKVSNTAKVKKNFKKYIGNDKVELKVSEKPDKKFKVIVDGKSVHFGSTLEDYTKHNDKERQQRYLARANAIKGDWRRNKYSANNLAINLLWK
jgi:hypothetical protein